MPVTLSMCQVHLASLIFRVPISLATVPGRADPVRPASAPQVRLARSRSRVGIDSSRRSPRGRTALRPPGGFMAGRVYGFENPDRFVAGAIGQPGSRIFYLQAREGGRVTSVALEKVQVALLAERLTELMREVRSRGADIPDELPAAPDQEPLDEPIVETFRVGTMAIVWDGDDESIVVEAREIGEELEEEADEAEAKSGDDEDDDSDLVRVRLRPIQALAFAQRALEVVAAARPPCPPLGHP